jgi:hypothetical protein
MITPIILLNDYQWVDFSTPTEEQLLASETHAGVWECGDLLVDYLVLPGFAWVN